MAWLALVAGARAQPAAANVGPLNAPSPLAAAPATLSPGARVVSVAAAERAHNLGFLSVAASLYRELLDVPGVERGPLTLALATVLLDAGQAAEADKLLAALAEPHTAAWRLRSGLAALQLRKRDAAQAQWDAIKAEEISERDRPWYYYFTGALYDTAMPRETKNEQKANEFYVLAEKEAPTELAKARFQLAAEQVRLRMTPTPSPTSLKLVKDRFDQWQGRESSYEPARQYAVMLALLGRNNEAVQFLRQNVLPGLPPGERGWRDEFNFMIGVLGDRSRTGVGRVALMQLVASGATVQRQQQALQLLDDASQGEPERGHFRGELARLLALTPAHPLRETLLYFRAQLALDEKDYAVAEESAQRLVREFPASPLRAHALGVLTQSAWEQQRFRLAAAHATEARKALPTVAAGQRDPAARARADLGLLAAEAWFRLGEYRNAADTYAGVLKERPEILADRLSGLIFQRILAEIRARSPNVTAIIDEFAADRAFSVEDRWHAEWNLARELRVQGKIAEAYARVGGLLSARRQEDARLATMRPELRARLAWLHTKLAFESDQFEAALAHADALLQSLGEVTAPLRDEIASTTVLLRAQAELQLGREPAALATLKRLRAEFPNTDAAVRSYLIESGYYAQQDKIPEAQQRLTALTDNKDYANHERRPYALFQLALLSERLGQEKDLEEANRRIEELVNLESAGRAGDLIFDARLQQGHLLRKLSQFPQAQRAYEYLINNYAQRPDIVLAQLALADCHNAQSATDPSHADKAQALYEQLRDQVGAPTDVRVEAGHKLGLLLVRRRQLAQADNVWWHDVIDPFLKENKEPFRVDDQRLYWLARTLFELGKLREEMGKFEEARAAYQLIADAKLGHAESSAREALKRLGEAKAKL